ncbi:MAG: c-type cytochrome [Casimicrobiaceae bacterium]
MQLHVAVLRIFHCLRRSSIQQIDFHRDVRLIGINIVIGACAQSDRMNTADRLPGILRRMAMVSIPMLIFAPSGALSAAEAPASLTHYRCYICHADREAGVGPAFADVAAFYRGRKDATSKIANEIRQGIRGGGPWHMPPHPEISPAEAREMARYIMSLPRESAAPLKVDRP